MAHKPHPADVYMQTQIARAAYYTAYYMIGQGQFLKEEHATLEDAKAAADRMTRERKSGRRACIYAVTPEGLTFPIAEAYPTAASRCIKRQVASA